MTKSEKRALVELIFTEKGMFEKHILNVLSNSDRIEVMGILAKRIVRILLKEELNFMYMKNLDNFKFSLIINLLFHELANEWVSFAEEELYYSKDEALEVLQEKKKTFFLLAFVKEYFRQYKIYFVQEIADTFIDLVEQMPSPMYSNHLIDEVLQSGFVRNKNIMIIYNYSQLWSRVKNAHDAKKKKITACQLKISETKDIHLLKKYELEEELLKEEPLAFFDDAVLRLRNTMVQYMMQIETFPKRLS